MANKKHFILTDREGRNIGYVSDEIGVHHIAGLQAGGFTVELNKPTVEIPVAEGPIEGSVSEYIDHVKQWGK